MSTSTPPASVRGLPLLLAGLAMVGPFSIDAIFPAFPALAADLHTDKLGIQQTISVYLGAYALMSLLHGPLSDAFGRRRVILAGLAGFMLASIGCALATDLPTLLAFRAVQGLCSGAGLIVGRAAIRDVYHDHQAQRVLSQVSMMFGIAPAIAPVIGGWLLVRGHWPLIFWFLVGFALLLLATSWRWLPETHPPADRIALRPGRLARDYLKIVMNPRFQRLAAAGGFNFAALFLFIASAPAFVLDILRLNERQFGWFFAPMIGGMTLGAFVSGRTAGRISGIRLAGFGFACSALAVAANLVLCVVMDDPRLPWAVAPIALHAFGIALVFPIVTLAVLDMYPHRRGAASSMQMFTGQVVNVLVAGVLSPFLSHSLGWLTAAAAALMTLAWGFWRWELHVSGRNPGPTSGEPGTLVESTGHV